MTHTPLLLLIFLNRAPTLHQRKEERDTLADFSFFVYTLYASTQFCTPLELDDLKDTGSGLPCQEIRHNEPPRQQTEGISELRRRRQRIQALNAPPLIL